MEGVQLFHCETHKRAICYVWVNTQFDLPEREREKDRLTADDTDR